MKTEKINAKEWERIQGTHRLFKVINEKVIVNYRDTSPLDLVNFLLSDPYGTNCDGIVTLYPNPQSKTEYFIRMQHALDEQTKYSLELGAMESGHGGFLKRASTMTEPEIIPDITGELANNDLMAMPWIARMRTAFIIPVISIKGEPATTILFTTGVDGFDAELIMSNLYLTYATTHIILSWILRMESLQAWQALDEELRSVGKVQQALLPKTLPHSDVFKWSVNYTTSTHASGDYFDFFEIPDGKIGVIIADVSGHGSPAAIVMAMIRLLLHTYPSEISPPAEVLKNTNRLLAGNILPGHFVTAFYGILDPATNQLTYSNAGHCHPLLYRAGSGEVEKLKTKGGLPLGVISVGTFDDVTVELSKGDSLVLYTDGLREAVNDSNDMYGDERVSKLLKRSPGKSADDIRDAILGDLRAFTGGDTFTDDLTLLVLKVSE